jgi:hypothetical protein
VLRVSHETIYLSLFVQRRGALRRELQRCLRTGRAMRHPRAKRLPQGRGQLRDTLHISQRPPEAADRAVPGHWEGDLRAVPQRPHRLAGSAPTSQPLTTHELPYGSTKPHIATACSMSLPCHPPAGHD